MKIKKTYQTKTGVELRVIDGGQCEVSDSSDFESMLPQFDAYTQKLMAQFDTARISLSHVDYIGLSAFELTVNVKIDASQWTKAKNRHALLGDLTLDLSNYLSRMHGLNEYVVPNIDSSVNAKNGLKTLVFRYQVSESTAYAMGASQNDRYKLIQGA